MKKKHLGRVGSGSGAVCNGGSSFLRRVTIDDVAFASLPMDERCARCAIEHARRRAAARASRAPRLPRLAEVA
jgi:hypothetical protein